MDFGSSGGLGDEKHDFGGQVQEIKCTVSSYESTVQKAVQVSEGIDLEGRATPSADDESLSAAQKHSVTVKVILLGFTT